MKELAKFCDESTMHGVALVKSSETRIAKMFWLLVTLLAVGLISQQVYVHSVAFREHSMEMVSDFVQDDFQALPRICLCVLHRLNKTRMLELLGPSLNEQVVNYIMMVFYNFFSAGWINFKYYDNLHKNINSTNNSMLAELSRMPKADFFRLLSQMQLNCEALFVGFYVGNKRPAWNFCEHFRQGLTDNGPCFTLKEHMEQYFAGPVGGMKIIYRYPGEHLLDQVAYGYSEDAIYLYSSLGSALTQTTAAAIAIGGHAFVSIRKERFIFASSHCSPRYERPMAYFETYTQHSCQYECMINASLEFCGCTPFNEFLEKSDRSLICSPAEANACRLRGSPAVQKGISRCMTEECPFECRYSYYTMTLSPTIIPTAVVFDSMHNDDTTDQQNDTIIHVYYDSTYHIQMAEVPSMTSESFLSNIGGTLSVWAGASLITVIHGFYLMIQYLTGKIREAFGRKQTIHITKS